MGKEQRVVDKLGTDDKKLFRQCESVIRKGVKTFVAVGTALKAIQERQLYREKYTTFEEYCKERWEMSRSYAYRLIDSAKITSDLAATGNKIKLSPMGDKIIQNKKNMDGTAVVVPDSERQVRPLKQLRSAQARREVWSRAVDASPDSIPTAAVLEEKVKEKLHEEELRETGGIVKLRLHPDPDGIATWMWEPVSFDSPVSLRDGQLAAVMHSRPPKNSDDPEDRTVIVCPGSDLFSTAVPDKVIEDILAAAEGAPHWTFLFTSKNYLRLFSYTYPKNVWAGVQVSSSPDFEQALTAANSGQGGLKFLYCCPLSGTIELVAGMPFHWVVICGSDPQPEAGDVLALTCSARQAGVPVLWAESLEVRAVDRPRLS